MSIVAADAKPHWLIAPEGHPIRGLCVAPWGHGWGIERLLSDEPSQDRFNDLNRRVVRKMGFGTSIQVLLPANETEGERIIGRDEPWVEIASFDSIRLLGTTRRGGGLWLTKYTTVLTELDGRPFLFAKGHEKWLALRYSPGCTSVIEDAFNESPSNITVHALFGAHRAVSTYYEDLTAECKRLGMRCEWTRQLPKEATFGYAEHPSVREPNLGIFALQ